jgi:hypothetical protein
MKTCNNLNSKTEVANPKRVQCLGDSMIVVERAVM